MIPYITFEDFIVFLEGVQVPVSNIELAFGRGSSMCRIAIMPNTISKKIYPLTRVHVFYKFENQYRLLFDGRIIDTGYLRTPERIQTQLTASDFSYFLGLIPIFFFSYDTSHMMEVILGGNIIQAPFGKINTQLFQLVTDENKKLTIYKTIYNFLEKIFVSRGIEEKTKKKLSPLIADYPALYITVMGDEIINRFNALTTDYAYTVAREDLWNSLVDGTLGQGSSEYSTIMNFIQEFLDALDMIWVTCSGLHYFNPTTGEKGKSIINLLMLPYLFAARVPNCNVIAQMEYCQISQNILNQPTRMLYMLPFAGIPATTGEERSVNDVKYLIAPSELSDAITKTINEEKKTKTFYQIYYSHYTKEESIRGINNIVKEMPKCFTNTKENFSSSEKPPLIEQAQNFAQKILHYDFLVSKLSSANVYISMIFNPFLVPGFPALIYDKNNEFTGRFLPLEVSHSISASGTTTTINGAFYQNIEKIQIQTEGKIVDPIANIVNDVSPALVDPVTFYKQFGIKFDLVHKGDSQEFNMDNLNQLESIKLWMLFAKDRYIPTITDFEQFMQLTLKNTKIAGKSYYYFTDENNKGYYHPDRRKIIEDMLSEILMKKIKLG